MFRALFSLKGKKVRSKSSRNAPRYPIHTPVTLVLENGAVARGTLRDMSVSGAFLYTEDRPFGMVSGEEGDLGLDMDQIPGGSKMRFPCEVVRLSEEGISLRFLLEANGKEENFYPDDFMEK